MRLHVIKTGDFHDKMYCEEASNLGLRPGVWPNEIEMAGEVYAHRRPVVVCGDVHAVDYTSMRGFVVRIYND